MNILDLHTHHQCIWCPKRKKCLALLCRLSEVNAQTENQSFSLPRIFDVTNRLHGARVFSSLDLRNVYWQVNIRPSDRKYTAFSCPRGTFQFRKSPMGIRNSAFSFQMAISYFLKGTEDFAFAYIDDILVFSKDTQKHKRHLHDIANRLNAYVFTLKMKKSTIEVSEIEMLGHKINKDGIFVLQDRIAANERLPEPTSIKELRHAMDLINFQGRFIKNAAKILLPLTKYLQGKLKTRTKSFFPRKPKKRFLIPNWRWQMPPAWHTLEKIQLCVFTRTRPPQPWGPCWYKDFQMDVNRH